MLPRRSRVSLCLTDKYLLGTVELGSISVNIPLNVNVARLEICQEPRRRYSPYISRASRLHKGRTYIFLVDGFTNTKRKR